MFKTNLIFNKISFNIHVLSNKNKQLFNYLPYGNNYFSIRSKFLLNRSSFSIQKQLYRFSTNKSSQNNEQQTKVISNTQRLFIKKSSKYKQNIINKRKRIDFGNRNNIFKQAINNQNDNKQANNNEFIINNSTDENRLVKELRQLLYKLSFQQGSVLIGECQKRQQFINSNILIKKIDRLNKFILQDKYGQIQKIQLSQLLLLFEQIKSIKLKLDSISKSLDSNQCQLYILLNWSQIFLLLPLLSKISLNYSYQQYNIKSNQQQIFKNNQQNSIKSNQYNSIKSNQQNSIKSNQYNSIKSNQQNSIKSNQYNSIKHNQQQRQTIQQNIKNILFNQNENKCKQLNGQKQFIQIFQSLSERLMNSFKHSQSPNDNLFSNDFQRSYYILFYKERQTFKNIISQFNSNTGIQTKIQRDNLILSTILSLLNYYSGTFHLFNFQNNAITYQQFKQQAIKLINSRNKIIQKLSNNNKLLVIQKNKNDIQNMRNILNYLLSIIKSNKLSDNPEQKNKQFINSATKIISDMMIVSTTSMGEPLKFNGLQQFFDTSFSNNGGTGDGFDGFDGNV